jgi:hypothetical protein
MKDEKVIRIHKEILEDEAKYKLAPHKQASSGQSCQKCFSFNTVEVGIDYSDKYGDGLLQCFDCGREGKIWTGDVFSRRVDKRLEKLGIKALKETLPKKTNEYEVWIFPFQNKDKK